MATISHLRPRTFAWGPLTALAVAVVACGGPRTTPVGRGAPAPLRGDLTATDPTTLYRTAGLLASPGPVAFVGTLAHFATLFPDTTLSLITLSMPTSSLTFTREGSSYRANYQVRVVLRRGADVVREVETTEQVRVGTMRETNRVEEAVVFQQYVRVPPGTYAVSVMVRDEGSSRSGSAESTADVPTISRRGISSLLPIFEADSRDGFEATPRIISSPRSTAVFGRDSVIGAYVEAYNSRPGERLYAAVRSERGTTLWRDSIALPLTPTPLTSVMLEIPISPVGIGSLRLAVWRPAGVDTSRAPLFVSFGNDLPVASFEDMLSYLRFYASRQRLESLRDTAEEARGAAWATFLRETDPNPATPSHEGLQAYFARIQTANGRFRQETGPGWLTDRGMVYVSLGDPDFVQEPIPTQMGQRNGTLSWEYQRFRLRLYFVDRTGLGRWELSSQSDLDFQAILRRELVR